MSHPNNKQTKIQTQSSADRITTSLSPAHQNDKKKKTKNSPPSKRVQAQVTLYVKFTQTPGPTLQGYEPKEARIQPQSLGKGDLKHKKFKKKKTKRQRNTAQMKEQPRNTQVQINEEEIGKLPEKNSE